MFAFMLLELKHRLPYVGSDLLPERDGEYAAP